jgi:predicted nucleic acid-binding protein
VTHLDTSFLIDLLREHRRKSGPATALLTQLAEEPLAISVFVACELEAGAARAQKPERERQRVATLTAAVSVVQTDERFAPMYGETLAKILDAGRAIATIDLLIAVTALLDKAPLVTKNHKHFDAVPGLRLITY